MRPLVAKPKGSRGGGRPLGDSVAVEDDVDAALVARTWTRELAHSRVGWHLASQPTQGESADARRVSRRMASQWRLPSRPALAESVGACRVGWRLPSRLAPGDWADTRERSHPQNRHDLTRQARPPLTKQARRRHPIDRVAAPRTSAAASRPFTTEMAPAYRCMQGEKGPYAWRTGAMRGTATATRPLTHWSMPSPPDPCRCLAVLTHWPMPSRPNAMERCLAVLTHWPMPSPPDATDDAGPS